MILITLELEYLLLTLVRIVAEEPVATSTTHSATRCEEIIIF